MLFSTWTGGDGGLGASPPERIVDIMPFTLAENDSFDPMVAIAETKTCTAS